MQNSKTQMYINKASNIHRGKAHMLITKDKDKSKIHHLDFDE